MVECRNAYVFFLRVRDARPISPETINIIEPGSGVPDPEPGSGGVVVTVEKKVPEFEIVSVWVSEQTPPGQKKAWISAGVCGASVAENPPFHVAVVPSPSLTVPARLRDITANGPSRVKTSGEPRNIAHDANWASPCCWGRPEPG
jgi:hypothetical protein